MYRKYQSSTKSSRNERLAQLSEQESVIEKKKREILAKLEAQKKKETEEALRKLEPSSIPQNSDKKDSIQSLTKQSLGREKDTEDEELKTACPRNAFSNDGSFLDQFKKMSSGLVQKNLDLSTSTKVTKRDEDFDGWQKSRKEYDKKNKEIWDYCERKEYDLDEYKESNKKLQTSNVQHQVSPPGGPHLQGPAAESSKSNLHCTIADAQSKVISSQQNLATTTYQNVARDVSHTEQPNQATNAYAKTQSDVVGQWDPILNATENTLDSDSKKYESGNKNSSTSVDQMSKSCTQRDALSRVSPALTDDEAEDKDEDPSRDAVGQGGEGGDFTRNPGNKRTLVRMDVPESMSNSKRTRHDVEEGANEAKMKHKTSDYDSVDSDSNSKDSYHSNINASVDDQLGKDENMGYQADYDDESYSKSCDQRQKKTSFHKSSTHGLSSCTEDLENPDESEKLEGEDSRGRRKRKRKSRWGDEVAEGNATSTGINTNVQQPSSILPIPSGAGGKTPLLSKLTRSDPGLIQYARQTFGSTNLSEEDWKKAEDHYKINLLYQDMVKKRAEIDRLEKAGKFKYEYDSDEDVEGGTWEHKLRQQEMMATQLWADELTRQAAGKHHIGDFLPPEELERFMEKYNAVKQGRNPDLSDYKEFKLKEDNVGYRLLQKMGWNEGQGLGQDGTGITNPVNKASTRHENQGLGVDRPDGLQAGDDEYDAYRKRMMLAYRFRPNPLNNPRRPYY